MLDTIQSPRDLNALSYDQLRCLAKEIRARILQTVAKNGGHLASNLGIVELTLGVHRVFNAPRDKILFDVGHQAYVHKLLTGRRTAFSTLRKQGGISGFTKRSESAYDPFGAGHAGTSVSAALGMAHAAALLSPADDKGDARPFVVAIVGDGAFTNGMIYEAINHCARKRLRLIVVLNDNEMSISENVGGLSRYLSDLRTSHGYFSFKHSLENALSRVPLAGNALCSGAKGVKGLCKKVFVPATYFEDLGLDYLGPVDGNDLEKVETVLREAKSWPGCSLVHVRTRKGMGYPPAEAHPDQYHSAGPFDLATGKRRSAAGRSFSQAFGDAMCEIAGTDARVCAITAAMRDGTGLTRFAREYPNRYFDAGIAEEHATTFAAGLSAAGMRPVFAVYSTFMQRVYDQLLHDASIQQIPLVLALDRAGLVPGDGVTHQGIYDCALLRTLPGSAIYAPDSYEELADALQSALHWPGVACVRYPKDAQPDYDRAAFESVGEDMTLYTGQGKPDAAIVTYGRTTRQAWEAAKLLRGAASLRIVRLKKAWPLDYDALFAACGDAPLLYLLEEGICEGGIGQAIAAACALRGESRRVLLRAVDERQALGEQANQQQLYERCGFLPEQIADELRAALGATRA